MGSNKTEDVIWLSEIYILGHIKIAISIGLFNRNINSFSVSEILDSSKFFLGLAKQEDWKSNNLMKTIISIMHYCRWGWIYPSDT